MNIKSLLSIAAISIAAISIAPLAHAKETNVEKTTAKDSKTISLFDGKTLNGWKVVGGSGKFKVEDGCIVGYGDKKGIDANTFLRTEKIYGDFELTYEFKFDNRRGNSGLMFRAFQAPSEDGNGKVGGYQSEGDNGNRSWTAGLFDENRRKWLFPHKKNKTQCVEFTAQGRRLFKWKEWNTIVIRCKGNHIQTWLNGEKRVDFIDTHPEHDTREGFFGLQVHQGKACNVRWRNLQLKEL